MVQTRQIAAALIAAVAMASNARAITHSDRPASIQVWPKIVVDTSGQFTGGVPVNTLITLSNVDSTNVVQAHCFYTNGNSHCADNPARVCRSSADCVTTVAGGGTNVAECDPGWDEMDFDVNLTHEQPLAWYANGGLQRGQFPLEGPFFCVGSSASIECESDAFCTSLGFAGGCDNANSNLGSGIPPVPEDPFIGSLTCFQWNTGTGASEQRLDRDNMLIGDASILQGGVTAPADVAKYNAIGLAHITDETGNEDPEELNDVEFASCPATLIMSFLFDGAIDPLGTAVNQTSSTELTLVPCSEDFATQTPGRTTAQFLVFNEFEQRFSTSRTVDCLFDGTISSIDTRNPARSIFSAGIAGTIAGQMRIRGVGGNNLPFDGETVATSGGLLGLARESIANKPGGPSSAAYNLHQQGSRSGPPIDFIDLP
jgi:hypothetical protein